MQLYFDNASTSYPKPPEMVAALAHYYDRPIGSYGRDAAQATLSAGMRIEELRDALAHRLGIRAAEQIAFADNATTGINTILQGIDWQPGDVIYTSPLEHNAVMRPLSELIRRYDVRHVVMPHEPRDGRIDTDRLVHDLPAETRLAIINMEGNVNGLIQPLDEVCRLLGIARGIPIMADTTQWLVAGKQLQTDDLKIDYLAFTGHKGLLGPTGTGGFFIRHPQTVRPLIYGGTGQSSREMQPAPTMPERYVAGTINSLGLVALAVAMESAPTAFAVSPSDFASFLDEVEAIANVRLYRARDKSRQGYLASLTHDRMRPGEIADRLRNDHGIVTRHGLHCAPLAHRTLGTLQRGALRLSISPYHTVTDLQYFLTALTDVLHR